MRCNLLRHINISVATLFQISLGISCDKRGSRGFLTSVTNTYHFVYALITTGPIHC